MRPTAGLPQCKSPGEDVPRVDVARRGCGAVGGGGDLFHESVNGLQNSISRLFFDHLKVIIHFSK
jgi:hypothetical protein